MLQLGADISITRRRERIDNEIAATWVRDNCGASSLCINDYWVMTAADERHVEIWFRLEAIARNRAFAVLWGVDMIHFRRFDGPGLESVARPMS